MSKKTITAYSNLPKSLWVGQTHCIVGISVGQMYHEGSRLRAIFDFVAANFGKATILIADSLKRYTLTMKKGGSPVNFWEEAIQLGNEWLNRNKHIIQSIPIPYEITQYSYWLTTPEYPDFITNVHRIYKENSHFEEAVHIDASNYLARYQARKPQEKFHLESLFPLCIDFLLEEVAVCALLSQSIGTTVECYPGTMPQCYKIFSEYNIDNAPRNLKNWVYVSIEFTDISVAGSLTFTV